MISSEPDIAERLAHTYECWFLHHLVYLARLSTLANRVKPRYDGLVRQTEVLTRLPDLILDQARQDFTRQDVGLHHLMRPVLTGEQSREGVPQGMPDVGMLFGRLGTFPIELFKWNRQSRRVYHLPGSLATMLETASLADVPWSDLVWPFDSFLLTFSAPFSVGPEELFDTVLVTLLPSDTPGKKMLCLRMIQRPRKDGVRIGLTKTEMQTFHQHMERGRFDQASKLTRGPYKTLCELYPTVQGTATFILDVDVTGDDTIDLRPETLHAHEYRHKDELAGKSFDRLNDRELARLANTSSFLHIVLGWVLYLETLSGVAGEWKPSAKKTSKFLSGGATGVLTDPESIFRVEYKTRLDPLCAAESKSTRNNKGWRKPHWRKGYKKRPWGTPPGTPKTIKVPPVLVRADLIPIHGLPAGSHMSVPPPDVDG